MLMAIYNYITCHLFLLLSQAERSHCSMLGWSWEMLLDASHCGQFGAWHPAEEIPNLPCCPSLLTGGRDVAKLGSSSFQVLLHHLQDMLLMIYFTAAPGIKYSCLSNGNTAEQKPPPSSLLPGEQSCLGYTITQKWTVGEAVS